MTNCQFALGFEIMFVYSSLNLKLIPSVKVKFCGILKNEIRNVDGKCN